jgi:hypothetical protein
MKLFRQVGDTANIASNTLSLSYILTRGRSYSRAEICANDAREWTNEWPILDAFASRQLAAIHAYRDDLEDALDYARTSMNLLKAEGTSDAFELAITKRTTGWILCLMSVSAQRDVALKQLIDMGEDSDSEQVRAVRLMRIGIGFLNQAAKTFEGLGSEPELAGAQGLIRLFEGISPVPTSLQESSVATIERKKSARLYKRSPGTYKA